MQTIIQNNTIQCKAHPKFTCQYINLYKSNEEDEYFACVECLEEMDNPYCFKNLLFIEQIIQSNEQTIFNKWPPVFNEEILKSFKKSSMLSLKSEELTSEISIIKQNFSRLIDSLQKSYICSFEKLEKVQDEALVCYNILSDKEQFKQILLGNSTYEEIKEKLNNFLNQKKNCTYENSNRLQSLNNNINSYVNEIHCKREQLNKIKKQIVLCLASANEQIDFRNLNLNIEDLDQNSKVFNQFIHKFIMKNYNQIQFSQNITEIDVKPQSDELLKQLDQMVIQLSIEKSIDIDILKYTNVVKPKFRQFDELIDVEKRENDIIIRKKESEKWDNISYVERPFETNQKYIIQLKLGTNIEYSTLNQLYFGFTYKSSVNNIDYISNTKFGFLFRGISVSNSNYGQTHMKKGSLHRLQKEYDEFEIRLSQSEGILQISDYPLYENIVELDPSLVDTFKTSENLLLGFEIYSKNNNVAIKKIRKVSLFPPY